MNNVVPLYEINELNRCPYHRSYRGIRMPCRSCKICARIYLMVQGITSQEIKEAKKSQADIEYEEIKRKLDAHLATRDAYFVHGTNTRIK